MQLRRERFIFVGATVGMAREEALVFVHRQVVICCHILQLCCSSYFSCPVLLAGMKTDCDFHSLKKKKKNVGLVERRWLGFSSLPLSVPWKLLLKSLTDKIFVTEDCKKVIATKSVVSLLCHTYVLGTVWVAKKCCIAFLVVLSFFHLCFTRQWLPFVEAANAPHVVLKCVCLSFLCAFVQCSV